MINYLKVAEILGAGWTSLDAQQAHEALEEGFMVPDEHTFSMDEACLCMDEPNEGLHVRLSAPGYMDCTDWAGPFANIEEGLAYLIQTYGE